MPENPVLVDIGRILAGARVRLGLGVEPLAEAIGVPPRRIHDAEAGRAGLTTTDLGRLCGPLCLDEAALLAGREETVPEAPSVFFRHAPMHDFLDEDLGELDRAVAGGRALIQLGDLLGVEVGPRRAGTFAMVAAGGDRPGRAARDGYERAREVRARLGLGHDRIEDIRLLAEERLEVAVTVIALRSPRATAVAVRRGAAAAIVLNANDAERVRNPLLTRVHIAHELCHLVFDPSPGGLHLVVDLVADKRDLRGEQRARGFAAEFLMPQEGLVALLGEPAGTTSRASAALLVKKAREHFGTPHEIAAHHLVNHGYVDELLHDWISTPEPQTGRPRRVLTSLPDVGAPPRLLAERARRAHDLGLVTDGEARSLLDIDGLMPLPWDRPS